MRRPIVLLVVPTVVLALGGCGGATQGSPTSSPATAATPTSSPSWPDPSEASLPASTVDSLQAALAGYIAERNLVGATAAVVTRDGSWSGAAGKDGSGTALAADSALLIASTTKTFTAAEILLLSSTGAVDLDAPVTDYVTLPFDTRGATIRQLATMTSGFPELPESTIRPQVSADLGRTWTCSDVMGLVAADAPRLGTQGGPAAYNGLNYYALGMVIEKVTGQSLAQAIRTDLLAPVGLKRVWTETGSMPEKPTAPVALPVDDPTNPVVDAASGFLPSTAAATSSCAGAGMAADAASLARWGYLLYGGHVIDASLVSVMTTPNPQGGDQNYGFGTMIDSDASGPFWGHAGNYVQYTSVLLVWPSSATAVAVLVPVTGGSENDVRGDLAVQLQQVVQS